MPRAVTFKDLIEMTRAEARDSTQPNLGVGSQRQLEIVISGMYEHFWYDFDWKHLEVRRDVLVQNGQRYYNFPEDLDWDRVFLVQFKEGKRWRDLGYGINNINFNTFDSDLDERSWPVWRWDIVEDTDDTAGNIDTRDMFEVWPIPNKDASKANPDDPHYHDGVVRFEGIRKFHPLVEANDRCELDAQLIALHVAAEILTAKESPLAPGKLQKAQAKYLRLKGGHSKRKIVGLNPGKPIERFRGRVETRREGTYPYPPHSS